MKYITSIIFATMVLMLGGCKTATIYKSEGISVPHNCTNEQVKRTIIATITENDRWYIQEIFDDRIRISLKHSGYSAVVDLIYDGNSIRPTLVSSTNLKQSETKIHKTYNERVMDLEQDLRINLGKIQQAQVAAPKIGMLKKDFVAQFPKFKYRGAKELPSGAVEALELKDTDYDFFIGLFGFGRSVASQTVTWFYFYDGRLVKYGAPEEWPTDAKKILEQVDK